MINLDALERFGKYDKKSLMAGIVTGQGLKGRANAPRNPAPAGFPQELWDAANQRANAMIAAMSEEASETPETPDGDWTFDKDAFCFGLAAGRALEGWELDGGANLPDGWAKIVYYIHVDEPDTIEIGIDKTTRCNCYMDWGDGNSFSFYSENLEENYSHNYESGDYVFTFIAEGHARAESYIDAQIREIGGYRGYFGEVEINRNSEQFKSWRDSHAIRLNYFSCDGFLDESTSAGTLRAIYLDGDTGISYFGYCSHIEYVTFSRYYSSFPCVDGITIGFAYVRKSLDTPSLLEILRPHNHLREIRFMLPMPQWVEIDFNPAPWWNVFATLIFSDGEFRLDSADEFVIPDGVTRIGECKFKNSAITGIAIPDSVANIGRSAFELCFNLTNVTVPDNVTNIGIEAFAYCNKLTDISIGSNVVSIGSVAFEGTALTSVTIPDSVTEIGGRAFRECSNLANVMLGNSVTNIGSEAFHGCTALTSVTIPDSVTRISYGVFFGCTALTSVTIPDSVTEIGARAFQACPMTSVTIPNSVTEIGSWAFENCKNLTHFIIPDGVTEIEQSIFHNCTNLVSVAIPSSITVFNITAFYGCDSLKDVYYSGTQEQWEAMRFFLFGGEIEGARFGTRTTIHYNSTGPDDIHDD